MEKIFYNFETCFSGLSGVALLVQESLKYNIFLELS